MSCRGSAALIKEGQGKDGKSGGDHNNEKASAGKGKRGLPLPPPRCADPFF